MAYRPGEVKYCLGHLRIGGWRKSGVKNAMGIEEAVYDPTDNWDERYVAHEAAGCTGGLAESPTAELPHSCDEWNIGGPEEIRAMIADLEAVLAVLESVSS